MVFHTFDWANSKFFIFLKVFWGVEKFNSYKEIGSNKFSILRVSFIIKVNFDTHLVQVQNLIIGQNLVLH